MRAKSMRYGRVVSMGEGTFETQRFELEVEVEDGDNEAEVFAALKSKVEECLGLTKMSETEYREAKKRVRQYERRRAIEGEDES